MFLHLTQPGPNGKPQLRQDAIDTLRATFNIDASESVFLGRELLRVRATVFEQAFPEFLATQMVAANPDVTPADAHYTYQNATMVGKAGTRAGYSERAPRADVYFEEATPVPIVPITSSFGYTFQEMRQSAQTGKNLDTRKAMAARRAIAQDVDEALSIGKTINGVAVTGLINQSGNATYTTPTGSGGSKAWTAKTPDEIYEDLAAMVRQVPVDTNQVERITRILLPDSRFEFIATKKMGIATDTTILGFFRQNHPDVDVRGWWRLETVSGVSGSGKRAIGYNPSAEKQEMLLPVEFEQFAPQIEGFETTTLCHARVGGVVAYKPKSIIYGDEI
jgi:hypothetical protein